MHRSRYFKITLVLVVLLFQLLIISGAAHLNNSNVSVSYVTYFGGSNIEEVSVTACRPDGAIAMVGHSNSPDIPVSQNAFQSEFRGGDWDAYVVMYDDTGHLTLCTYLGGSAREHVDWVSFDNSGNIVVVGSTLSDDFPVTANAIQSERAGEVDGFLATISDNGSLLYGTYFGGNMSDSIEFVTVDNDGNYLFGGTTWSAGLATEGVCQIDIQGGGDAYIAKLSPDESEILLFSYLGGSNYDRMDSMSVDSSFNFILSGLTRSTDFPTTSGAFQETYTGAGDVFLTKIAHDGSEILWSTFIGGSEEEYGRGVDVDSSDNVVVTGPTQSSDIEVYNAFQPQYGGGACDIFVGKFSSDGNILSLSYLGGNQFDIAYDTEFDMSDRIVIVGRTLSDNYPLYDPIQSNRTGHLDLTVTILKDDMESLVMSTFFGGTKEDSGESLSISSDGKMIIAGRTASDNLPCTENAAQKEIGGSYDSFLIIISLDSSNILFGIPEVMLIGIVVVTLIVVVTIIRKKHR